MRKFFISWRSGYWSSRFLKGFPLISPISPELSLLSNDLYHISLCFLTLVVYLSKSSASATTLYRSSGIFSTEIGVSMLRIKSARRVSEIAVIIIIPIPDTLASIVLQLLSR